MGEFEAAGEMVTGALLARAVAGGPEAGDGHATLCLNCGTALIDAHCHRCGQSAHVHRSLAAVGHEIVHGVFHFEGKFWRTLPLLAWRPGELTRRYVAGERARFVSPMAIFLFSIFAMFAVFSVAGIGPPGDLPVGAGGPDAKIEEARKELAEDRSKAVEKRREAETPERRARYQQRVAAIDEKLEALARYPNVATDGEMRIEVSEQRAAAAARLAKLPADDAERPGLEAEIRVLDAMLSGSGAGEEMSHKKTGWYTLDHGIEKWRKNPSLMIYKLQSSVYKFSWLLIPLSLPFLWLLFFWKRQYKLYDHAIFIIYSISFMSLLFIAVTLLSAVGVSGVWLALMSFVVPFVHITRQLQQAYRLRWFSAILRALVLSFFIWIVIALFLLILVAMGMTG